MTKDAKKVFAVIYKEFKRREDSGISRDNAIEFESPKSIEEKLSKMIPDNVDTAFYELGDEGLLKINVDDSFTLETKGIEFKENLPAKAAKEIIGFIESLPSIIP